MKMGSIIVIAGPTAVGKTEFAIRLCQNLNAEIISADSMQVYKFMDIGTAKPDSGQQLSVKHHLIDLVEPDREFSVADFQIHFDQSFRMITAAGKIPVMVGGTGLYIRACLQAYLFEDPGGANQKLRNELQQQALKHGPAFLYDELAKIDPPAARRIHPNDLRRVIRAIEVYQTTGIPLSQLQKARRQERKYRSIFLFLDRDREELYRRIEERVDQMMAAHFPGEVESLLDRGYSPELKPMQGLGYKQITEYLQKKITLEQAVEQMKQQTKNYAKRQLTWFRKEPIDFWANISSNKQEFFPVILNYIKGRLKQMSNTLS